jgi:hypothetical protein
MSESGPGSVLNVGAYAIESADRAPLAVIEVNPHSGNVYWVTTDAQGEAVAYTMTVSGTTDAAGNSLDPLSGFGQVGFSGFVPTWVSDWALFD